MSAPSASLRQRFSAWRGVVRSLAVYHGDKSHIDGLRRLYGRMVRPGERAFDIGAHVGDRTRVLRSLGAKVVAVEPQPRLASLLRLFFRQKRGVVIVEAAVSDAFGEIVLHLNSANPTVSSASQALIEAARGHAKWRTQRWDASVVVPAFTLDMLMAEHGPPAFIKIDVEGLEDRVLKGLSKPVPVLSFEFTTVQRDVAIRALEEARRLGYRRFDLSVGESHRLRFGKAVDFDAIRRAVTEMPDDENSGDVYCFADGRPF